MDIVERLRAREHFDTWNGEFVSKEAADEIERLREVLQKIADIEYEYIPTPITPNEADVWTVLAMAVGLAEKALKEGE